MTTDPFLMGIEETGVVYGRDCPTQPAITLLQQMVVWEIRPSDFRIFFFFYKKPNLDFKHENSSLMNSGSIIFGHFAGQKKFICKLSWTTG
jgi:hypothetical protein